MASDIYKIAIVGSGPAGLSAAARASILGVSHILLEKTDHISDTIFRFQRGKHVMATPSQLVRRSPYSFEPGSREGILKTWDDETREHKVNVRYHAEVKAVTGAKGDFKLTLASGEDIRAETIVLAIGTQGNPNLMACPGAALPHVQYQLDDPAAYVDEAIFVIGGGDAGIENALGLAADPAQANKVTLVNRSGDFPTAKEANVKALMQATSLGRMSILLETTTTAVEPGWITVETKDGPQRLPCDRIIARMGAAPPRRFLESFGIKFTSEARTAFPVLSPTFETSVPGIHAVGALAGYPLIKHSLNQGYDVAEFLSGNLDLKPADEPILEERLKVIADKGSVAERLEFLRQSVEIFNGLSPLQMREFMLDAEVMRVRDGDVVFRRNDPGSSLFAIAGGQVRVRVSRDARAEGVTIGTGSIVGEVGLISGRKRGATVRAVGDCILVELARTTALKLMRTVVAARETVERITTERQILQIFGSGLEPSDLTEILATAESKTIKAGEAIITEGAEDDDIYIIRSGSMVVEKTIGGKPVFLSYVPAGSYQGEMALIDGTRRVATVRAAIKSEVIKLQGAAFRKLLAGEPDLLKRMRTEVASRRRINAFIEDQKDRFGSAVDMYSEVAAFLVKQGLGEATDVLLIDEELCIGCDNCEKACADSHDGISRLDREAGRTYAHLHVPTSCRHCEHPYCMTDCPPDAIHRGADGEVFIDDTCIGCGNCQRYCPYDVIRMDKPPPKKPGLLSWFLFGSGPGPGEPSETWKAAHHDPSHSGPKVAIKCDMCAGKDGGPACVRACPTGAAIRAAPEALLSVALLERERD